MNAKSFRHLYMTLAAIVALPLMAAAQDGLVTINQDEKITQLLQLKGRLTKENKLLDRYKIQLYSGDLNSASAKLTRYRDKVGVWTSSIKHETPNYKVWIGNFRNRLEADRALVEVSREFPDAFIFKPDR